MTRTHRARLVAAAVVASAGLMIAAASSQRHARDEADDLLLRIDGPVHIVRGDTLGKLSKKYGVSVPALRRANRLKNNKIRESRTYLVPIARARPAPPPRRLSFPPRRLPPARAPARIVTGDKPSAANTP